MEIRSLDDVERSSPRNSCRTNFGSATPQTPPPGPGAEAPAAPQAPAFGDSTTGIPPLTDPELQALNKAA